MHLEREDGVQVARAEHEVAVRPETQRVDVRELGRVELAAHVATARVVVRDAATLRLGDVERVLGRHLTLRRDVVEQVDDARERVRLAVPRDHLIQRESKVGGRRTARDRAPTGK